MKIEKYLNWIEQKLLNYPDIHLITLKMLIDGFKQHLSKKELQKFSLHIDIIREITSKQISLDSFVNQEKTKLLEQELNNHKGVHKK